MAPGPIDNATGCLECTPRTDRDALAEGTVTKEVRAKELLVISALVNYHRSRRSLLPGTMWHLYE